MSPSGKASMLVLAVLLAAQWSGCTNSEDSLTLGPAEEPLPASRTVLWLGDGVWAEQVDGSDDFIVFEARFRVLGETTTYSYGELLERESQGCLSGDTRIDMLILRSESGFSKDVLNEGFDQAYLKHLDEPPAIETCWTCIKLCRAEPDCVRECTKERCG